MIFLVIKNVNTMTYIPNKYTVLRSRSQHNQLAKYVVVQKGNRAYEAHGRANSCDTKLGSLQANVQPIQPSQTCGGIHLHLPPSKRAKNGMAGNIDGDPMTGHDPIGHGV